MRKLLFKITGDKQRLCSVCNCCSINFHQSRDICWLKFWQIENRRIWLLTEWRHSYLPVELRNTATKKLFIDVNHCLYLAILKNNSITRNRYDKYKEHAKFNYHVRLDKKSEINCNFCWSVNNLLQVGYLFIKLSLRGICVTDARVPLDLRFWLKARAEPVFYEHARPCRITTSRFALINHCACLLKKNKRKG